MNRKYIFFDIDGTLTNHNPGGIILPSTRRTLRQLEENGHFIAIATGRSYSLAKEKLEDSGMKNMVCAGGNGLVIDNELRYVKPLEREKALALIEECKEKGVRFAINKDDSANLYTHYQDFLEYSPHLTKLGEFHYLEDDDYTKFAEIHKVFLSIYPGDEVPSCLKELDLHYARYHPDHIVVEPDDKYQGIKDMIKEIGGNLEDVVVFGDGHNDLSMMRQAAISIAMGNAIDELKEIADFITLDCSEDGIEYACKHFGWI